MLHSRESTIVWRECEHRTIPIFGSPKCSSSRSYTGFAIFSFLFSIVVKTRLLSSYVVVVITHTHIFDFACTQARKTRKLDDARTSNLRSGLNKESWTRLSFSFIKSKQKSFPTARFTQLTQFNSLRPCFWSRVKIVDVSRSLTSRTTTEKYDFRVFSPASRCYETHEKNKILYCMRGCVCASSEHNINIPPGRCWAECIDIVGQGRMRNWKYSSSFSALFLLLPFSCVVRWFFVFHKRDSWEE